MTPSSALTVTIVSPAPSYTMWGNLAPQYQTSTACNKVELGVSVKFGASVSAALLRAFGSIKSMLTTGTHSAHLWDRSGNLLASATFTNETSGGWQQVDFATPVSVTANTTYIASYHTNIFVYTVGYFATAVNNGALCFLANGEDGSNSVYLFGPVGFTVNTYQSANYWVNVAFEAE